MKIYTDSSVYEAAYQRIRWVFKEFDNVFVWVSGGKDSTVIFNLAMQVAKETGRLPLNVGFLDQEAEWEVTIEQIKKIMYHPDVSPYWIQAPFRLFNATSKDEHWLHCWGEEDKDRWMRDKNPIAIKENTFGVSRFKEMFTGAMKSFFPDTKTACLAGIRADENPARYLGLTRHPCHKWVTWGGVRNENDTIFYPIYDWRTADVWKAIHDNGWDYCKLYDYMYQYGVRTNAMRVSNIHHETALQSLFLLQEIEPQTYDKLTKRIKGIDMACKMGKDDYFVTELPDMFGSWEEYRDYLLYHLVDEQYHWTMYKRFKRADEEFGDFMHEERMRVHIASILANDWEGIYVTNWESSPKPRDFTWRRRQIEKRDNRDAKDAAKAAAKEVATVSKSEPTEASDII